MTTNVTSPFGVSAHHFATSWPGNTHTTTHQPSPGNPDTGHSRAPSPPHPGTAAPRVRAASTSEHTCNEHECLDAQDTPTTSASTAKPADANTIAAIAVTQRSRDDNSAGEKHTTCADSSNTRRHDGTQALGTDPPHPQRTVAPMTPSELRNRLLDNTARLRTARADEDHKTVERLEAEQDRLLEHRMTERREHAATHNKHHGL